MWKFCSVLKVCIIIVILREKRFFLLYNQIVSLYFIFGQYLKRKFSFVGQFEILVDWQFEFLFNKILVGICRKIFEKIYSRNFLSSARYSSIKFSTFSCFTWPYLALLLPIWSLLSVVTISFGGFRKYLTFLNLGSL